MNKVLQSVTDRICERSEKTRAAYLKHMAENNEQFPPREKLSCGNVAHAIAANERDEKLIFRKMESANVAIVSAYNDMLSAHQPLAAYPTLIKQALQEIGCTAQFAGGVPAMCDGVTQGQAGMELSLFSRDQIALSTTIALCHNTFDAALMLGVCDKIVPGLLIGALRFGHLPIAFIPAGPMPSGLPNKEKARVRQEHAKGNINDEALLDAECQSYHSPGTCTFYGTANTNQMLMEIMGLHLPGSSFVQPGTALRELLVTETAKRVCQLTRKNPHYTPIGHVIDEKAIVNGLVGLLATGGSTNLTIHLIAIARAAGIIIHWQDFADLSSVIPLLARVYPNGQADVNDFYHAGGVGFLIRQLISEGLLHNDVKTIMGDGLSKYTQRPTLEDENSPAITWVETLTASQDEDILRPIDKPFSQDSGLGFINGNLGCGVIKLSAVDKRHWNITAPAIIFESQDDFLSAFKADKLNQDCIVVLRNQGPRANGMPELHKLTPSLGVLLDRGFHVALITDGRMSGASGKVPAAIHLSPEASLGGPLAKLKDGDMISLNAESGELNVDIDETEWQQRPIAEFTQTQTYGLGRELFQQMRHQVSSAETGATIFTFEEADNE